MSDEQLPTVPVSIAEVMASPRFQQGVVDVRAGRGFPRDYDEWSQTDELWAYERGRVWACLVPRNVALKRNGKVTNEAINWFMKFSDSIP